MRSGETESSCFEVTCTLETERVRLRQIMEHDAGSIAECLGKDDRVARMTSRIPWPYSRSDADAYVAMITSTTRTEEKEYVWALELKTNSRFIGVVGLHYHEHHHDSHKGEGGRDAGDER